MILRRYSEAHAMAESSRVDRRGERVDALRWGDESSLAIRWFLQLLKQGVDVHLFVHSSKPGRSINRRAGLPSCIHYVRDVLLQKICWKLSKTCPATSGAFTGEWLVHMPAPFVQRRAAVRRIEQSEIDIVHEPAPCACPA